MTALVYYLTPNGFHVAMDSLGAPPDHAFYFRTSKFLLLPHLQTAICCTGMANLLWEWHHRILTCLLQIGDVTELDRHTPESLRAIVDTNREWGVELASSAWMKRATMYHFGYSPAEKAMVAYAYRSTECFASERLEYSFGYKPTEGIRQEDVSSSLERVAAGKVGLKDFCLDLISQMKAIDDASPLEQRLNIGGPVHFLTLAPSVALVEVLDLPVDGPR